MARRHFEHIYQQIRQDLTSGRLRPGDKLPAEREWAEELGVGRPAVREALRTLEASGVIELRKGVAGGAFVGSGDPGMLVCAVSDLLILGTISLEDLTEARMHLMGFAVRLAAQRGTDADFKALEDNIEAAAAMDEQMSVEERVATIAAFYTLLGAAAHNQVLVILIRAVTEIITQILLKVRPHTVSTLLASRRKLLQHLRERDADAAVREIVAHLTMLHAVVIERSGPVHSMGLTSASGTDNARCAG